MALDFDPNQGRGLVAGERSIAIAKNLFWQTAAALFVVNI